MARTSSTITGRRLRFLFLILAVIISGLSVPFGDVVAQERVSFLVARQPDSLTMYNQYQQRLTRSERDQLEPFFPIRIIDKSTFLSDGFTRCMSAQIAGSMYYIQIDEAGKTIFRPENGFLKIYDDVIPLADTVQVLTTDLSLTIPGGRSIRLEPNVKLRRYFADGPRGYVLLMSSKRIFGWVRLDPSRENDFWSILRDTPERGIPSKIADRIISRLNDVNRRLTAFYRYFSRESGTPYAAPQWRVTMSENGFLCVLIGDSSTNEHWQSTRLLVRELEGLLLGTELAISAQPRRIRIGHGK